MMPIGGDTTRTFLAHREEIFAAVGAQLFAEEQCRGNRRDWVKKIFAAYDNDATMAGRMDEDHRGQPEREDGERPPSAGGPTGLCRDAV